MKSIAIIVPVLMAVAYVTLGERKVLGSMQLSKGPNTVGVGGMLQPMADGVKLFTKETMMPTHANMMMYLMAPMLGLTMALLSWAVMPLGEGEVMSTWGMGMLYMMAVSSISVYAVIMSGWGSNSQYAFLGAMSAAAQMMSYEVSMGMMMLTVVMSSGEMDLTGMVMGQKEMWYVMPQLPGFMMFVVSALAETNRAPFDLTEGESELVSGYNVEYSAMTFALFFLGEYSHMMLMSVMTTMLFLGGWYPVLGMPMPWMGIKMGLVMFWFMWVRASFPRMSYDQLMGLMWKSYLPLSLAWLMLSMSMLLGFGGLM